MNFAHVQYEPSNRQRGQRSVGEVNKLFTGALGPDARKTARSSPGGGASIGPSALDRKNRTIRGSARSHHIVRSLCDAPRRHHCRPVARFMRLGRPSAAILGRLPSPGVAGQGIWLM